MRIPLRGTWRLNFHQLASRYCMDKRRKKNATLRREPSFPAEVAPFQPLGRARVVLAVIEVEKLLIEMRERVRHLFSPYGTLNCPVAVSSLRATPPQGVSKEDSDFLPPPGSRCPILTCSRKAFYILVLICMGVYPLIGASHLSGALSGRYD
ncbi:T. brucei spp.-specific protein [Trypanosoma brucei gambiense DAL972]|uniref:T. brucei spp.-specific protein n=1 Tax=Trypanosoma brucei gambiense (strain MHOM/CI/86/DAL972) TaxID=679716 RepID=D0A5Z1_TRYB9|nr:T. brucei spp.-specific protein [Trypanosoma brucei gambiense DAL972]CBH17092.1 T. brucei spp.-specific protein [Trypanosoma brucei gambiense DAL972]|eukprot:XP_011779356.1 T. brucei spp.-specific protein [Trypanosoma brucei gambiense DAL972]